MTRPILILHTGGTIGMVPSDQGYVPAAGFHDRLLAQLPASATAQLPAFELLDLEPLIDSSNLVPTDWHRIAQALISRWQDYSGFILLHGTDTMAYTASALSFLLQGCNKPVVVTGSQIPLSQLRNDALENLITSLLLASRTDLNEVVICFNGRILRGNRARKVSSAHLAAFDSPNFPWLGEAGIDITLESELLLPAGKAEFALPDAQVPTFDADAVALLQFYPGISASVLSALTEREGLKGLVLLSYGAGNPPEATPGLIEALEKAAARGITLLNLTQCQQGAVSQGTYATGATLNRIGVIPGSDLTPEAAFAKLHVLLGKGLSGEALHAALRQPLCGECS